MLLEKLLAVCLTFTLSLFVLHSLRSLGSLERLVKDETELSQKRTLIHALLNEPFRALDEHRLPLLPLIHKNGRLTFSNGELHQLSHRKDSQAPHPESDLISYLILEDAPPLYITSKKVCGTFDHAVAYTGDRFFEVLLHPSSIEDGICGSFSIPKRSIFFLQPPEEASERVRQLLPVKSLATLYVSKARAFRYVQHRGEEIIENQPALDLAPLLQIKADSRFADVFAIRVQEYFDDVPKPFTSQFQNILARKPPEEILFQIFRGRTRWRE